MEGNAQTALRDVHSVVLSEDVAHKLFGDATALDKLIRIGGDAGMGEEFKVTGVYKDASTHSHIDARFFIPIYAGDMGSFLRGGRLDFANNNMFYTYLQLGSAGETKHKQAPPGSWRKNSRPSSRNTLALTSN